MATLLSIGPADHGRPLSYEEFKTADWQEGYQYELIDGKLYVSPQPNLPQNRIEEWLGDVLRLYRREHPEIINYVSSKARVFVPDRIGVTNPEPDLTAYHDFPLELPIGETKWEDVSPVLVVEIASEEKPEKDLVRNVELYGEVPSIREYWIIDPREGAEHLRMLVYRRRGKGWQKPIEIAAGDVYETRLLPGFRLVLDPNA